LALVSARRIGVEPGTGCGGGVSGLDWPICFSSLFTDHQSFQWNNFA